MNILETWQAIRKIKSCFPGVHWTNEAVTQTSCHRVPKPVLFSVETVTGEIVTPKNKVEAYYLPYPPRKMSFIANVYRGVLKRSSTLALAVITGAFVFERAFDQGTDYIWETWNKGVSGLTILLSEVLFDLAR